jgi:hypothetical protein
MADLLILERGSLITLDASVTTTPDPKTTVGENWVRRLLKRQPHLISKYSRKYDYQRALCEDPKKISAWFQRVRDTIEENGILDCDIYNVDETGFQMGVASTAKVVTRSDRRNRPVVVQPGNREWTTVFECINAAGWSLDPMTIFTGKVHISKWYEDSPVPKTWRVAVSDNGWTTDDLTLEWLTEVFEPQTRSRTVGRYRLLLLDGHGSHRTAAFDRFCKERLILTEAMPPHSSHRTQPLDVGCFSVLKRAYGDLVKAMIAVGVHHIDKPNFLELLLGARKKTFTSKNIKSSFSATGIVPLDPSRVLDRLQIVIRTPSPPAPELLARPSSALPLKTPANIVELERIRKQRQKTISPTDRVFQKMVKGCQMAMHHAVLLSEENSRLRAENARQKKKRAQRRAFLQTGGTMTVGEAIGQLEAKKAPQKSSHREVRVEGGGADGPNSAVPPVRKRAPWKCSICASTEHTARKCPSK